MMFRDLTSSVLWRGMWLLESFVFSDLLFDDIELDGEVVREAAICQNPAEASRKIHRNYWKTSQAVGLFFCGIIYSLWQYSTGEGWGKAVAHGLRSEKQG